VTESRHADSPCITDSTNLESETGMIDFSDRVLLVTGAAGGIGGAIARRFVSLGARVLAADIDEPAVRAVCASIDPSGARAIGLAYNAARPEDAEDVIGQCLQRFDRLDFLVPAAAIYEDQPFATMTDEQWRRTMAVNLDGVFYLCRRAIPVMNTGGCVVTIASEAAHSGSSVGHSHYGASKGGVLALTRSLARELAPGIRVNTVSPGTIDTPMVQRLLAARGDALLASTPAGRFGQADEVACAVAFLCSEAASYMTGAAMHVNGGSYMGG